MVRKRFALCLLLLAACGGLFSAPLQAQSESILGSSGELYTVRVGALKDLFPDQAATPNAPAASSVMALDVQSPGSPLRRQMVNGTLGADVELLPRLIYESASNTVYLLWERQVNNIHTVLMLEGFKDGGFSEPIQLFGDSFFAKSDPLITLTRDRYTVKDADGHPVARSRTVLHVLWTQEGNSGTSTLYSPLVFEDGEYIGTNPVYRLNDLDLSERADLAYALSPRLLKAPVLEAGIDGRTVTVGFTSPDTQRFATVEIDVLPAALSSLADKARTQIIDLGAHLNGPSRQALADRAKATILAAGGDAFRPEILDAIADKVWILIASSPPQDTLQNIADKARTQIIDLGAKLSGRGLKSIGDNAVTTIAEIDTDPDQADGEAPAVPSQLIQLRPTSSRPAPNVGNGDVRLFVSETGERVIASWVDTAGNRLLYRSSDDGTWSDPREIKLSSTLSLTNAYSILAKTVRDH
jgi:hypothetical protein